MGYFSCWYFCRRCEYLTQAIGIISVGLFTVILCTIFWLALKATIGIRVHPEQEFQGLDISEHGMEAYNGFVKEPDMLGSSIAVGMDSDSGR